MSGLFTVLAADFLEESGIETPILQDTARLVLAQATSEEQLVPRLAEHNPDAILLFHDIPRLGHASFTAAPSCKCVVRAGVGYNNIDLDAARHHGVIVCNVPDYGTEEVADHAIMFLLSLVRRLVPCQLAIRGGDWHYRTATGTPRLRGKTFGIIGCGRIGTATALRARALGLNVVFYDPYVEEGRDKALGIRRVYRVEELLQESHFVSLHCYLDSGSYHLINARTLQAMRPGSYLINTARGGVVDQNALLEALDSGHLEGAALDVVEREPLDDERIRNHPKIILTPHSAFYSVEGFIELRSKAAEEIRRILRGEAPRNRVDQLPFRVP
ncbi:MAG: C-terminal binding protein [Isosphaeraceae bacterium]